MRSRRHLFHSRGVSLITGACRRGDLLEEHTLAIQIMLRRVFLFNIVKSERLNVPVMSPTSQWQVSLAIKASDLRANAVSSMMAVSIPLLKSIIDTILRRPGWCCWLYTELALQK